MDWSAFWDYFFRISGRLGLLGILSGIMTLFILIFFPTDLS